MWVGYLYDRLILFYCQLIGYRPGSGFWVGGRADENGVWKWVGGQNSAIPTPGGQLQGFENWMDGQPNRISGTGDNDCLVAYLWPGKNWYATPCWQGRSTLCMEKSRSGA